MVEKFEIDDNVSKEEILKEFQALDVVSQHEGAVESMAERIAKAKEKDKIPLHEGICEECGNYAPLDRYKGMLVCASCRGA